MWLWFPILYVLLGLGIACWDIYRDAARSGTTYDPPSYLMTGLFWPVWLIGTFGGKPFKYFVELGLAKHEAKLEKERQIEKGLEILKQEEQKQADLFAIAEGKDPLTPWTRSGPLPKSRIHPKVCMCDVCTDWEEDDI